MRELLAPAVPRGRSPQLAAEALVPAALDGRAGAVVVDLGCGEAGSVGAFRAADPGVRRLGVDHASVDVVFCKRVLEHVERLDPLIADVARVLRPGGVFVGSTSQVEPYHGHSTGDLTPYGFKRLVERHGLAVEELYAGIDGLTLVLSIFTRFPGVFARWYERRSPLNAAVDGVGRVLRWDAEDRNAVKLLFCGQFAFLATAPGASRAAR